MRGLRWGKNSFWHLTHQQLSKPWGHANGSTSSVRYWTPTPHPAEAMPVLWRGGSSPSDLPSPSPSPSGEYHSAQHCSANPCQPVISSKDPLWFCFFWKFPLFSPTVHLQYPTPKESYLLSDHDNSRKTAGQWAGALENSWVNTPYWLPAWGNIYLAGTGRIHRRCRPGAPVDGRTQAYH